MSYARHPRTNKLYFFQLHEDSLEWIAYPEMNGQYSLRWSTESRTWIPQKGIDLSDWTLDCPKAIKSVQFKFGKVCKAQGKFFINITAVLT